MSRRCLASWTNTTHFSTTSSWRNLLTGLAHQKTRSDLTLTRKTSRGSASEGPFECPADMFAPVDKGDTVLVVKFEESWDPTEGCSLENVLHFSNTLAEILEVEPVTLHLRQIDQGCVQLQFQIPSFVEEDIFPLSVEQERSLPFVGVTRLTCGSYRFPQPPEVRWH